MNTAAAKCAQSQGCMSSILEFLPPKDACQMQALNQRAYKSLLPNFFHTVATGEVELLFMNNRKQVYTTRASPARCSEPELLIDFAKIGQDKLGFSEIYFQFWVKADERNHYCWPLEQEAFLEQGYHVKFDASRQFESAQPIAKMPKKFMRPTFCKVTRSYGDYDFYAIGGDENRTIQKYTLKTNEWKNVGRLPKNHNLTVNVACTYDNKSIFTFMCDERMNIKSAVINTQTDLEEEQEVEWAYRCDRDKHKVDRFHVKCATAVPSQNEIHVVARGRLENMREQITTLLLVFKISADGLKIVNSEEKLTVLRLWPIIFPRQLDYMENNGKMLYMVQDTPDNEPFEVVAVDVTAKRKDGIHQKHQIRELPFAEAQEQK